MSPRVHHLGRNVRSTPNGPQFIPSPSAFTHSSSSPFVPPQFGSLSMFGRYYDDSSSGNSSNSHSSLDESDHTEVRAGDDGHTFDMQRLSDLNTSVNGSETTLPEYETSSNEQISHPDSQVDEPDRESHGDLVPLPSRSRIPNTRPTFGSYVYSSTTVPPSIQQERHHRVQQRQQQQQQQQSLYIPPESDPNYHSRRSMNATSNAFAAAMGLPPGPPMLTSSQLLQNASRGTSTDGIHSNYDRSFLPFTTAPASAFGFGTASAVGGDGRMRSGRGLGPPRREREREREGHRNTEADRGRIVPPQFRAKTVCKLDCRGCGSVVCMRGMKAMLLADTRVELFSTDCPPVSVQLVGEDYTTRNCRCKIRDVACIGCGGVCGYHITAPCGRCMEACNNGHFWMFHTEGVRSVDRLDGSGNKTLLWASLPVVENDTDGPDVYDRMCR